MPRLTSTAASAFPRLSSTVARLVVAVFALQLLAGAGAIAFLHSTLISAARDERRHDVALLRDALLEAYYDGGRDALAEQMIARDDDTDVFMALTGARTPPRPGPAAAHPAPLLINLLRLPRITPSATPHLVEIRRAGAPGPANGVAAMRVLPDGSTLIVGAVISGEKRFNLAFTEATGLTIAVSVALALVSALVLGLALDRRTRELAETARALAAGDFAARAPPHTPGDGFDELRDQMNSMAERIGRLVSELRSVSGALAHDLRSPVARLTAALDTALAAKDQGIDGGAAREALVAARADADALRAMLETALDLARVEGGAVTDRRVEVDLARITEDLVELYEPLAEQSGVSLETELLSVTAPIDRELVSRSLSNLIDNALKYGGKRIVVSTAPAGPFAEITVRDDGPGIAERDRARAIERFTRLDNARTLPGGGLGLAMVDAVARLHGGTLELGGDEGLIATLRLPRA